MDLSDGTVSLQRGGVGSSASSWPLRQVHVALLFAAPVLYAIAALLLGKKTGWDHFNYHWYNPFALLNDRFGIDIAVGHHATYYNPLSDVPLYLIATHLPAWAGGVFLGAMAGFTVALVGVLAYLVLPYQDAKVRTALAVAVAVFGIAGAGAFQEIGDPANDVPAAIGVVAALILIVRSLSRHDDRQSPLIGAGLLVGAAVALKLTIAVYAVGIGVALLFIGSIQQRLIRAVTFGSAALAGLLVVGGFWIWELWRFSGNPLFPYFNDFFQSPLLAAASHRDLNFKPQGLTETLLFPFLFTLNSREVSESVFRDAHVLMLYILIPFTALYLLYARVIRGSVVQSTVSFLFVFAAASYVAWISVFAIYRYLIPLEMLAPLLIALAISMWPMGVERRIVATLAVLVLAQAWVRIDVSDRQGWSGDYVSVQVPALKNPDNTLIVMTGHAPMSYVIPYFPQSISFLRIDGWLVSAKDPEAGLAREMRLRIDAHRGPVLALFQLDETEVAVEAAKVYGLQMDLDVRRCDAVTSNINQALFLCAARKLDRAETIVGQVLL